jgi:hypothetical protein
MTRVYQPPSVTNDTTPGPSSSTSLPAYTAHEQTPPAYDIALQDLTAPQRAFVAQQRNAINEVQNKPANSNNQLQDPEAQLPVQNAVPRRQPAAVPRLRQQDNQPQGNLQPTYDRRGALAVCILLTAFPFVSWGLAIWFVRAAKPNIPPPYPDQLTWRQCKMIIEGHPTQHFILAQAACVGAAFALAICITWMVPGDGRGSYRGREGCWSGSVIVAGTTLMALLPLLHTMWLACPRQFT